MSMQCEKKTFLILLQSDTSLIHKDPRGNKANGIIIGKATEWMFSKHQIKTFEKEFLGSTLSMYFKDVL